MRIIWRAFSYFTLILILMWEQYIYKTLVYWCLRDVSNEEGVIRSRDGSWTLPISTWLSISRPDGSHYDIIVRCGKHGECWYIRGQSDSEDGKKQKNKELIINQRYLGGALYGYRRSYTVLKLSHRRSNIVNSILFKNQTNGN